MKKNNVRFLATTLAATSLFTSSCYALGIGEMKLKSALNQNLQAEIGLILADGETSNDFKVTLASNEKFDAAGIPWTLFLSKIKFKISSKNGKAIIELSSTEALKEPFLDFIIEVNSAKGNVYREFTVLIDPPSAYQAIHLTPSLPGTSKTIEPPNFVSDPIKTVESYGPTHENETLWDIASQFNKQNNVSINKMVAAIFVANPKAFKQNSTHTLIAGKTLHIPSITISPEFFIATEKTTPKHSSESKKTAVLIKDKSIEKLLVAANDINTASTALLTSSDTKAEPTTKKSPPKKTSDSAIQQRVAELEKQLETMQQIILHKNSEMNTLKIVEKSNAVTAIAPTIAPPPSTLQSIELPTLSLVPPISTTQPILLPSSTSNVVTTPISSNVVSTAVVVTPDVIPASVVNKTVAQESYLGIPADLYYYVAGGIGSLLLIILGFLRLNIQNKTKQKVITEVNLVPETPTVSQQTEAVSEAAIIDNLNLVDSMFANFDMSNHEFEAAKEEFEDMLVHDSNKHDIDEVLYKVDVYCAYGNSEQAEKLLQDEFMTHTEEHDYALRLLKLYQTQEKKVAFKSFVFELVKLGKNDISDFWSQVSDIADEFYPEALFFMPPPAIPDSNATSTNEMFSSLNQDVKFEDDINFDTMSFEDTDDKEITFGELAQNNITEALENTDLTFEFKTFEFETSKDETHYVTSENFQLDNLTEFTQTETQIPPPLLDFNIGDFRVEEINLPNTLQLQTETDFELDGGEIPDIIAPDTPTSEVTFTLDNFDVSVITAPQTLTTTELDFELGGENMMDIISPFASTSFASAPTETFEFDSVDVAEIPAFQVTPSHEVEFTLKDVEMTELVVPTSEIEFTLEYFDEPKIVTPEKTLEIEEEIIDFSSFAMPQTFETEIVKTLEVDVEKESMISFDGFAVPEFSSNKIDSNSSISAVDLENFTLIKTTESPFVSESKTLFESASIAALQVPEERYFQESPSILQNEFENIVVVDTSTFVTSEMTDTPQIISSEKINIEIESEVNKTKKPLDFETLNELVEERIQQTYVELAKVHAKEEVQVEYLDMSDSQFADSLASEVLKKCQIKEQLCRQKITQEVLGKLC